MASNESADCLSLFQQSVFLFCSLFQSVACGTTAAITYGYDSTTGGNEGKGRTSMTDGSGSTSWVYNILGQLTKETKTITGSGTFLTEWNYDAFSRLLWMKYPGGNAGQSGETVDYGYASTGAVKSVTQHLAATPYVQSTTYDEAGRISQRVFGNNLFQTNYTYFPYTTANGLGRLQKVAAGTSGDLTSLQDLRYTYSPNGNVLTIQDWKAGSPQTQTFTYDHLDRLLTASASGGTGGTYSESYAYNSIGNLTSKGGVTLSYAAQSAACPAGALTKPHAAVSKGTNTYCYDQNGNQVTRNVGSAVTLTYNHDNQLTATSGGATSTFVYDGDGQRVKGTVAGVTTTYVGTHYEVEGATTRKYYYLGGQRVAMLENSTVYYLLGDHLGSTALTVNSAGAKYGELRYKAFGETRYTFGTTPTTFAFTGQRQESGLGLYFYNARWYDPALGQFIQADTIVPDWKVPQSLNRFSYSLSNPLNYTDPTGHIPVPLITGGIGLVAGAAIAGAVYYAMNRETFDATEFAIAVAAGGVAGGLIGSGVGLIQAGAVGAALTAATTAINVGSGATGGALGYMAVSHNTFDSTEFTINTVGGGITGGITGGLPSQGPGLLAKGLINQTSAVAQYGALQYARREPMTEEGVANAVIGGTVAGLADMGASTLAAELTGSFQPMDWVNPGNADLLNIAAKRLAGEAVVATGIGIGAGVTASFISSKVPPIPWRRQLGEVRAE
jgi:RHS repeat-associated protein